MSWTMRGRLRLVGNMTAHQAGPERVVVVRDVGGVGGGEGYAAGF
jgi:hypothetical protein